MCINLSVTVKIEFLNVGTVLKTMCINLSVTVEIEFLNVGTVLKNNVY